MKTILCFIAKELEEKNKEFLLPYNDSQTVLHLYTNTLDEGFSMGGLFVLYENLDDSSMEVQLINVNREMKKY